MPKQTKRKQKTGKKRIENSKMRKTTNSALRFKLFISLAIVVLFMAIMHLVFQNTPGADTVMQSSITPECSNPNNNAEVIYNRILTETDLNAMQVAGVVGNLKQESASTFSPFVHEYSQTFEKGGWGIAQWTAARRNNDVESGDYIGVVAYSRDVIGDEVFNKYYQDYGRIGYDCTPDDVPGEVNTLFLNAQIDFLVRELTYRPLGFYTTYNKLKNAESIDEASDIWLVYFEAPANAESLKLSRRNYAHQMYDLYGGGR